MCSLAALPGTGAAEITPGSQASPVFVLLVGCEHTAEKWERS